MKRLLRDRCLIQCFFAVIVFVLIPVDGAPGQSGPDPAEDDYFYARGLDKKGHVDLAIQEYQKFIRRHREHSRVPEVLYLLGVAAHRVGDFELGEKTLSRLADGYKDFSFLAEALFRRGDCLFELKRYEEAATAYGTAAGLGGKSKYLADRGLYWQGEALFRAGKFAGSVNALEKLWKKHPESDRLKEGLLTLAYAHHQLKAYSPAIKVFEEILRRYPNGPEVPEALYWKGASCLKANLLKEACKTFETFVNGYSRHRHRKAAIEGLGWARFNLNNHLEAARAYDLLAREVPSAQASKPMLQAARARMHGKAFKDARRQGVKVLDRGGPEAPEGGYIAALAAVALEDHLGAVTLFKRTLEAGPAPALRAKVLVHAAGALYSLGRMVESAASYDLAMASPEIGGLHDHALYHAGLAYHQLGELDRAEERFQQLIKRFSSSPLLPEARFALAENAYRAGDYPRAVGRYREFLRLHGKSGTPSASTPVSQHVPDAYFKLGCACYHAGDRKNAVDAFLRHLAAAPEGKFVAEVRYTLGRAYLDLNQPGPACDQFRRCAKGHPKSEFAARSLLALGRAAAAAGKEADALEHFSALKKKYPGSDVFASARFNSARIHIKEGDLKKAEAELKKTLEATSDPDLKARTLFNLAKVMVQNDRFEDAVPHARAVLALEGGTLHAEAQEILGFSLLKAGKPDKALNAFRVFLKRYPDHKLAPYVDLNQGIALHQLKDHGAAVAVFTRLDRAHPGFDRRDHVLYHLGLTHEALDDHLAMVEAFTTLLRKRPQSVLVPEIRFRLGEHYYNEKKYARAAAQYAAVNKVEKGAGLFEVTARYKEGWACLKAGKKEAAAAAFDLLTADHPKSEFRGEALFQAGLCLMETGRQQEGLKRFQAMVKAYPHHQLLGRAQVKAGECCLVMKKWSRALAWFKAGQASKADAVDLPVVHHGIGVASQMLDRHDSAIQAFEQVAARYEGGLAAECQFRIGQCLAAQKNFPAAVGAFLKVSILHEHPEWVPRSLLEAGKVCMVTGKQGRAARVFRELGQKFPATPWAREGARLLNTIKSPGK